MDETPDATETPIDVTLADPLTPDARARGEPAGTAVTLSDGREWMLSADLPRRGGVFDEMYDDRELRGRYDAGAVLAGAHRLLRVNYRLDDAEAFALVQGADLRSLMLAVEAALFGPAKVHRTYSDWIDAALRSVGLDPDAIPPRRLRGVLEMLAMSGRIVPEHQFISSAEFAAQRAALLNFGKDDG